MRQWLQKIRSGWWLIITLLFTTPCLADLPQPPSSDMADSSHDWIDVGGSMMGKSLKIICVLLAVIILVSGAGAILKSYHTAHEKQDLGYFFKMLFIIAIATAVCMGLIYAGYTVVQGMNS